MVTFITKKKSALRFRMCCFLMEDIGVERAPGVTFKCVVGYNHETQQDGDILLPKSHGYALVQNSHCVFTHSFTLPVI